MLMKRHIVAALREQLGQWEELLAGLAEEQIAAPHGAEGWSIKDEIAHLWAWQQRTVARMAAALDGGEPQFPSWPDALDPEISGAPDELNAWLYQRSRGRPWAEVHADWRAGFEQLLRQAEQLPEPSLLDSTRYPWMEDRPLALVLLATYDHHQEHYDVTSARLRPAGS